MMPICQGVIRKKSPMRNRRGKNIAKAKPKSIASVRRHARGVKPMRQMLDVPADPGGERAVLVVVVHRSEVSPGQVMAQYFHHAGLEINAEAEPHQQEPTRPRWRILFAKARTKTRGREEQSDEARFEKHSVRLITGKILRAADERKKRNPTNENGSARPKIEKQQQRSHQANPANDHERAIAGGNPKQGRGVPETFRAENVVNALQKIAGGQKTMGPDQAANLKQQGIKMRRRK